MDKLIDVGFLYPVIDGKIYVGQRGTEPYKGFYGPIGGKSEIHNPDDPLYVKDFPATPHVSRADVLAKARDKEFGHSSAVREFYEEAFQIREIPWNEVSAIFKIGAITDSFKDVTTNCQFYLAMIGRNGFNPSSRELTDIKPLEEVDESQLYPLAKASLFGLKKAFEKGIIKKLEPYLALFLEGQIPDFNSRDFLELLRGKATSIEGLIKIGISRLDVEVFNEIHTEQKK